MKAYYITGLKDRLIFEEESSLCLTAYEYEFLTGEKPILDTEWIYFHPASYLSPSVPDPKSVQEFLKSGQIMEIDLSKL